MNMTKKKILSVSAASIILLGMLSGCTQEGENPNNSGDNNDNKPVTTPTPSTMAEEQQSQVEEIEVKDFQLDKKELTFLASWERNPANGKNKDVALELFQTRFGGVVIDKVVEDGERFPTLASMVSTGQSPDFFSAGDMDAFPRGATANMFSPLDDLIDFNDQWFGGDRKAMNDPFMFNGKHYAAVISPEIDVLLIYNKKTMEENNLTDPAELLKQNKWDLDNCYKLMSDFCSKGEERYAIDGWWVAKGFSNASGVPFIGMKDGKAVNNLRDPAIEQAQTFLEKLFNEGLAYPLAEKNWKSYPDEVGKGTTLFYAVGYWALTEVNKEYSFNVYGEPEDVGFVPVPGPTAGQIAIPARVNAYMLCAGAPNPQGFAALMYCEAAANGSAEAEQITKDQYFNEYGWTDSTWEMRETMFRLVRENPVYDFFTGISSDTYDALNNSTKDSFHNGASWVQTRESIYDRVQIEIDKINAAAEG